MMGVISKSAAKMITYVGLAIDDPLKQMGIQLLQ